MLKTRALTICLLPVLVTLTACQTTDPFGPEPTTRTVETTTTTTVFTQDGPQTTTTHSVSEEEIERVPEQDIAGFWTIRIGSDSCLIELKINAIGTTFDRQAEATEICDIAATGIERWRLVNGKIVLRDDEGQILGAFEPPDSGTVYSGYYRLDGDTRTNATIQKTA